MSNDPPRFYQVRTLFCVHVLSFIYDFVEWTKTIVGDIPGGDIFSILGDGKVAFGELTDG